MNICKLIGHAYVTIAFDTGYSTITTNKTTKEEFSTPNMLEHLKCCRCNKRTYKWEQASKIPVYQTDAQIAAVNWVQNDVLTRRHSMTILKKQYQLRNGLHNEINQFRNMNTIQKLIQSSEVAKSAINELEVILKLHYDIEDAKNAK